MFSSSIINNNHWFLGPVCQCHEDTLFDYFFSSFGAGSLSIVLEFTYINIGFGAGDDLSPPMDIGGSIKSIQLSLKGSIMKTTGRANRQ